VNKRQHKAALRAFDALHEMGFGAVALGLDHEPTGRFANMTLETLHAAAYDSKVEGRVRMEFLPKQQNEEVQCDEPG
jgi:hypothetical protein